MPFTLRVFHRSLGGAVIDSGRRYYSRTLLVPFNWQNCRSRRCGSRRHHPCTQTRVGYTVSYNDYLHARKIPPRLAKLPFFYCPLLSVLAFSLALDVDNVGCVFSSGALFIHIQFLSPLSTLSRISLNSFFFLSVHSTTFVLENWRAFSILPLSWLNDTDKERKETQKQYREHSKSWKPFSDTAGEIPYLHVVTVRRRNLEPSPPSNNT